MTELQDEGSRIFPARIAKEEKCEVWTADFLFSYLAQQMLINRSISNTLLQSPSLLLSNMCIEKFDEIRKSEYDFFVFCSNFKA
jgi:hypothetical protein